MSELSHTIHLRKYLPVHHEMRMDGQIIYG